MRPIIHTRGQSFTPKDKDDVISSILKFAIRNSKFLLVSEGHKRIDLHGATRWDKARHYRRDCYLYASNARDERDSEVSKAGHFNKPCLN
jgi:hypothetical protein